MKFIDYFKVHKGLIISLILVFIISVLLVFLIAVKCDSDVFGGWASMISGIMTFIGATVLSLSMMFNTWKSEQIQAEQEKINVNVSTDFDISNGKLELFANKKIPKEYCCMQSIKNEKYNVSFNEASFNYLKVMIENDNLIVPIKAKVVDMYECISTKPRRILKHVDCSIIKFKKDSENFKRYEQSANFFVGFNGKNFPEKDDNIETKIYLIAIELFDAKGKQSYFLVEFNFLKIGSFAINYDYISPDKYNKFKNGETKLNVMRSKKTSIFDYEVKVD